MDALHKRRLAKGQTEETRRKISEANRRIGRLVPGPIVWTPEEDKLVQTLPAEEVVRRTGRSLIAVYARRSRLRVPDGRRWG
jgi:hypothetical protein